QLARLVLACAGPSDFRRPRRRGGRHHAAGRQDERRRTRLEPHGPRVLHADAALLPGHSLRPRQQRRVRRLRSGDGRRDLPAAARQSRQRVQRITRRGRREDLSLQRGRRHLRRRSREKVQKDRREPDGRGRDGDAGALERRDVRADGEIPRGDRPPMNSLSEPGAVEAIVARLQRLHDKRPRAWGKMTAHEMLCHLNDSFAGVLGERPISSAETWANRTIVKYIALHTTVAWPKGSPTRPEVDQTIGGTRPIDFERDRERTIALLRPFVAPDARHATHPLFGRLTRDEWMIWGYKHTDHHLRQFAL